MMLPLVLSGPAQDALDERNSQQFSFWDFRTHFEVLPIDGRLLLGQSQLTQGLRSAKT